MHNFKVGNIFPCFSTSSSVLKNEKLDLNLILCLVRCALVKSEVDYNHDYMISWVFPSVEDDYYHMFSWVCPSRGWRG